jgi:NAD(P)H-dependent flavin oxidoreductase YrpB (nitropropane dioxygenase family)
LPYFREAGVAVVHKRTSVRHARRAEAEGVDIVSIDGYESAGHPGEDDVPGLVLVPATVHAVSIPVVASGAIADGRGLIAALALGAEGVNMGTRFLCTAEAPVHGAVKARIEAATGLDTELIFRPLRNTARVARNSVSSEVNARLDRGGSFDDVRELVAGARGRIVIDTGDLDAGIWTVGLCQGLINDIPTVGALMRRIVTEVEPLCSVSSRCLS